MWLELTEAESGEGVWVNTDLVGHWVQNGEGTLCEMAYRWNAANEARTMAFRQPRQMIIQTLHHYRKDPHGCVTLHEPPRRQRRPRVATPPV